MKKWVKNEQGSMAVYAIGLTLTFIIILLAIFTLTSSVRKNQLQTELKIKEVYEQGLTSSGTQEEPQGTEYVTNGLILHYDGINNTGNGHSTTTTTWKDLSGNGNDGIITGGSWQNNSIKFTSSSKTNGVKTNKNFPLNFSGQTFSIAFRFSSLSGVEALFGARETKTDGFMLFNYNSDISLDTKGNSTRVSIGNKLQANVDYNMTFVFNGTNVKVYRYGVLDKTVSITNATLNNLPLTIFTAGERTNTLGDIYNVKVYDRALTDAEVIQNYQIDKNTYGF